MVIGNGVLIGSGSEMTEEGLQGTCDPYLSSLPRVLFACVPSPALDPSPSLWVLFVRISTQPQPL